jgi:hypothetical protein
LIPVGTPNVPLDRAFGTGYTSSATGRLSAPAFDVEQSSLATQLFDGSATVWEWTVSPQRSGRHTIDMSINVEWSPVEPAPSPHGSGRSISRTVWAQPIEVQVQSDFFSIGDRSLMDITAALGTSSIFLGLLSFGADLVPKLLFRSPSPSAAQPADAGDESRTLRTSSRRSPLRKGRPRRRRGGEE